MRSELEGWVIPLRKDEAVVESVLGLIEDTIRDSKLVDVPKAHFDQVVSAWAPAHAPERRRFGYEN